MTQLQAGDRVCIKTSYCGAGRTWRDCYYEGVVRKVTPTRVRVGYQLKCDEHGKVGWRKEAWRKHAEVVVLEPWETVDYLNGVPPDAECFSCDRKVNHMEKDCGYNS